MPTRTHSQETQYLFSLSTPSKNPTPMNPYFPLDTQKYKRDKVTDMEPEDSETDNNEQKK